MPDEFMKCMEAGGKIRTVSGPNKDHGLKKGEYVKYCTIDGKSYRGEVKRKMPEASLGTFKDIIKPDVLDKLYEIAEMNSAPPESGSGDDVSVKETKDMSKLKEAVSLDTVRMAICKALSDRFGHATYVTSWDEKYVIYSKNWDSNKYYKQAYVYDKKEGTVTFEGEPQRVEQSWKKMKEALQAKFIEAKSKNENGTIWDVILIEAGLSGNGFFYSPDVLREAVALFDGVPAYARSDDKHAADVGRSVKSVVGGFKNPKFVEAKSGTKAHVRAEFHIFASEGWYLNKLKSAQKQGLLNTVEGLSIVAAGTAVVKQTNGRVIKDVQKIVEVISVDPVAVPAAGGKLLKMVAANSPQKETKMIEKMLEALKKVPDLYQQIDLNNIDEDKVLSLHTEMKLREARKTSDDPPQKPATTPTNQSDDADDAKLKIAEAVQSAKKEAEEKYQAWVAQQQAKSQSQQMLTTKLTESKLPQRVQDSIRKRFDGREVFTEAEVNAEITDIRETLAELNPSQIKGFGGNAEVGPDEEEKTIKALDGFFENKDVDNIPRFRSFREAYITITGDNGLTGRLVEAKGLNRFTEALTTASWAEILGDSITRRMLTEYASPELSDWLKIVSDITPISDFRTNRRMRLGGFNDLPPVAEAGTYQSLTSPGDEEATYSIAKKGGTEEITMEMIANDDVGAIRRIPQKLGRTAARTLYKAVFDIIVNNANVSYEAVNLFDAAHGNLGSTALSATSLNTARIAMIEQQSYGGTSGDELGLTPKYLLVPAELQDMAFRLVNSTTIIGATNNAGTEPNIYSTLGLNIIMIPYWTDANDWALVANPSDCPTIEVGFYQGREEPELFVQDQPNVGSLFTADKITYKIRHIYGTCVLDHRGMYKSVVA